MASGGNHGSYRAIAPYTLIEINSSPEGRPASAYLANVGEVVYRQSVGMDAKSFPDKRLFSS